jgi:hypothetical protein
MARTPHAAVVSQSSDNCGMYFLFIRIISNNTYTGRHSDGIGCTRIACYCSRTPIQDQDVIVEKDSSRPRMLAILQVATLVSMVMPGVKYDNACSIDPWIC